MKTVTCKDMGVDCQYMAKAETKEGIINQLKEHAKKEHKEYWDEKISKLSNEDLGKMVEPVMKDE